MLNFVSTEIHRGFGSLFHPKFPDEVKNKITKPILIKKFEFINQFLKDKKFIMGNDFTLPDAYLFVVLQWADKMGVDFSHVKILPSFYNRLTFRDSIK